MSSERTLKFLAAALLALVAFTPATAQKKPDDLAQRIQRIENGLSTAVVVKGQTQPFKLADRMAHYKAPGVSIAVINNGKIEWAKGYGLLEAGSTTAVTPATLFQAVSAGQPVVSLAALALVQQGKLSLDEDVNLKLQSWKVPDSEFSKEQKVTLRRLLSHSAGLTVPAFRGYASGEPVPTLMQVLNGEKPANSAPIRVDILPGSRWRYSSGGYTVLQQLLIDVTGKSLPQLMRDLVLDKLEMNRSTYDQPLPETLTVNAATAHRADGAILKGKRHTYPEMAAAGLWTTPSELARFAIEVQQSYTGKTQRVLSQEMAKQMLTKQAGNYGLGFNLWIDDKSFYFGNGGSNEGFKCQLAMFAETGQGAVLMTNGDQGSRLLEEIIRAIAKEYEWPARQASVREPAKIDPALCAEYAGEYQLRPDSKLVATAENGRLFLGRPGGTRVELFPESATRFFVLDDANTSHTFNRNAQGKVSELVIETGTQKATARRTEAIPKLVDFSWLLGSWKHESANSTTHETWRRLSDRTFEGESWRVSKTTQQRVFGESLLLAEMASEIFYLSKVPENQYPVPFKLTSSGDKEAVFENPKHDFPQRIHYKLNPDGTLTAIVDGEMNGQRRKIEFRYIKAE
jgi:CubicO group peptidase (beta-lactamase class C family)